MKNKLDVKTCIFHKYLKPLQEFIDIESFFTAVYKKIYKYILRSIKSHGCIKSLLTLVVVMEKYTVNNDYIYEKAFFQSSYHEFGEKFLIKEIIPEMFNKIICSFECFTRQGSGWKLHRICHLELRNVLCKKKMVGGSRLSNLPLEIQRKRCVLDLNSKDNMCFYYAVAAGIHNVKLHAKRTKQYEEIVNNFYQVEVPMSLGSLRSFEKLNRISVNVFKYNSPNPRLIYCSKYHFKKKCHLLLHAKHFYTIRNINRFFSRKGMQRYPCAKCFLTFSKQANLVKHAVKCKTSKLQSFEVPPPGTKIKFKNYKNLLPSQFVIYADFETFQTPINKEKGKNTILLKKHEPSSFGAIRICTVDNLSSEPYVYHGKNVIKNFLKYLKSQENIINKFFELNYPLHMTKKSTLIHNACTHCQMCKKKFDNLRIKCRDHNHLKKTDNYRRTICNACNLTYASDRLQTKIQVIMHNLGNYDAKLIFAALGQSNLNLGKLNIIPRNTERFLSFSIGNFQFIDSFQHLTSSLSTLVENLKLNNMNEFFYTRKFCPTNYKLLVSKQPYPYSFAKKLEDYNVPYLPSHKDFKNELKNNENISIEDYNHAKKVYDLFQCKRFLDYHLLYLKVDCLLLCDVFEAHRKLSIEQYELDPVQYFSSSQYTMDALLRFSQPILECLPELEMYEFLEQAKRGGICAISKRFSNANNVTMESDYDPSKESTYLLGLDANNLYGYAMKQTLPYGDFQWLSVNKINEKALCNMILNTKTDAEIGYFVEVDLIYPTHLHDRDFDYPLCPEKLTIKTDMLSPYNANLRKKLYDSKKVESVKLAPNLYDKSNYVTHYENLKFYVKQGIVIKRLHRVLQFRQSKWLADYIKFNTDQRLKAKSKFAQGFFKLMNNAAYGKLLEDVRKRNTLYIVQSQDKFNDLVCKPNFKGVTTYTNSMVGIEMMKEVVILNKPIYAGVTVLELSKLHMYKMHKLMTQKLFQRKNITLLCTDTDSLLYEVRCTDLYTDLRRIKSVLDTSNYPQNHFLYSTSNRFIPGKFKDENPPESGNEVIQFCGLKSKMYSILFKNQLEKIKAKGVSKNSLKNVSHSDYVRSLTGENTLVSSIFAIRSYKQQLYTIKSDKHSINAYDDKRYPINAIETLPYGHYKIKN